MPKQTMWLVLALTFMGTIAFLSLSPHYPQEGEKEKIKEIIDNVGHIPAYALLCFLWIKCLSAVRRTFAIAVVIAVSYGILMEYFQSFVPGRYPSLLDIGSNTLGALTVVVLMTRRQVLPQS